jgi:hypothetical protein
MFVAAKLFLSRARVLNIFRVLKTFKPVLGPFGPLFPPSRFFANKRLFLFETIVLGQNNGFPIPGRPK